MKSSSSEKSSSVESSTSSLKKSSSNQDSADPGANAINPDQKNSKNSTGSAKSADSVVKKQNDPAVQGQTDAKQSAVSKSNADNQKLPATGGEQRGILTAIGAVILAGLGAMIPFRKKSGK